MGIPQNDSREKELLANGVDVFYVPAEVIEFAKSGRDVYDIQYISPAKRIMQAEELQGIMTTTDFATAHVSTIPDLVLSLNDEEIMQRVAELTGSPMEIVNDLQTIKDLKTARQQAMAQQTKDEQAVKMAAAAQSMGQAAAAAGSPSAMGAMMNG